MSDSETTRETLLFTEMLCQGCETLLGIVQASSDDMPYTLCMDCIPSSAVAYEREGWES